LIIVSSSFSICNIGRPDPVFLSTSPVALIRLDHLPTAFFENLPCEMIDVKLFPLSICFFSSTRSVFDSCFCFFLEFSDAFLLFLFALVFGPGLSSTPTRGGEVLPRRRRCPPVYRRRCPPVAYTSMIMRLQRLIVTNM